MSLEIDSLTKDLYITKGDKQAITFVNTDGTEYNEFTPDDILTLSVKKTINDKEYVYQTIGEFTGDETGTISIPIEVNEDVGTYYYDVEWVNETNGIKDTIIPSIPCKIPKFVICNGITED